MDVEDQHLMMSGENKISQFWPEYSQSSYEHAFQIQEIYGDYTKPALQQKGKFHVKSKERLKIITLIADLH